ncbi:MAG TPA: Spi family protease inhibitor, partial [Bacteroidales bacterium]|nr:Spi family protease inhibitor [Bacteroidales bacterium]
MRKFCLSIVALATIVTTFAQNVPFETAQQIAVNFFSTTQSNGIQKNNPVLQSYIGSDNGENLYYIFNYENQGFVVVAGDYQSTPILAYSIEGIIDLEKLNPAMKMWLESHGQAVKNTTITNSQKDLIKKEWDNILNNSIPIRKASKVGPFTTSVWNQDRYYNAYCPEDLNVTGEIGGNYDNHVPN